MKDKPARALAIVALVFMAIFLASFTATIIDPTLLGGGIVIVALCSGVFVLIAFIVLKVDGRGFSLTQLKNESELQKIEQALKEQEEQERAATENSEKQTDENSETTTNTETDEISD